MAEDEKFNVFEKAGLEAIKDRQRLFDLDEELLAVMEATEHPLIFEIDERVRRAWLVFAEHQNIGEDEFTSWFQGWAHGYLTALKYQKPILKEEPSNKNNP